MKPKLEVVALQCPVCREQSLIEYIITFFRSKADGDIEGKSVMILECDNCFYHGDEQLKKRFYESQQR